MIVNIPHDFVLVSSTTDVRVNTKLVLTLTFAHPDLMVLREKKRYDQLSDMESMRLERLREESIDIRLDANQARQLKLASI